MSALERSSAMEFDTRRVGAHMQLEAVKAWALAVLQGQQTIINNLNACAKQQRFWNGTVCVASTGITFDTIMLHVADSERFAQIVPAAPRMDDVLAAIAGWWD